MTREILVFKTNVDTPGAIRKLAPLLDKHSFISKWNFDLEDCDRILRVEVFAKISGEIIGILRSEGFDGEELF